jgi:hypothetical protein
MGIHGEEKVNCLGIWKVLGFGRLLSWFLIGSYIENLFKQQLGLNRTFQYLCERLGPHLRKLMRNPILMEDRIAMSLI